MATLSDHAKGAIRAAVGNTAADQLIEIADAVDALGGDEAAFLDGVTAGTGAASKALVLGASTTTIPGNITFNEDSADVDYRLESNANAQFLNIDGNACLNGQIALGAAIPTNPQAFVGILPIANATGVTANQSYFHIQVLPGGATVIPTGTGPVAATLNLHEPNLTATGTITEAATLRIVDAPTEGGINAALWVDAGATRLDGTCYIGDTANANVTLGLTINQGAADDLIFACKSADVATVLTTVVTGTVETDDFFTIQKTVAAAGGALLQSLSANAANTNVFRIESYGGQASTTHSTAGRALMEVYASQHDGANALADVTNDGNVFAIRCRSGAADVTVWMVDEDGAPQSIVDHATFDEHDDLALLRSFDVARSGGAYGFVKSKFDAFLKDGEQTLIDIGILGCPLPKNEGDERPLMNMKRLAMLQNGALHQLHTMMLEMASVLTPEQQAKLPASVQAKLLPSS